MGSQVIEVDAVEVCPLEATVVQEFPDNSLGADGAPAGDNGFLHPVGVKQVPD
jgi:hypothetical protein